MFEVVDNLYSSNIQTLFTVTKKNNFYVKSTFLGRRGTRAVKRKHQLIQSQLNYIYKINY